MAVKNEMRRWVDAAIPEELAMLADKAGTTVGTLRQLAGGYRNEGKAVATSSLAISIEKGTKQLARPGLPPIMRGDISPVCAGCDLYRKHKHG